MSGDRIRSRHLISQPTSICLILSYPNTNGKFSPFPFCILEATRVRVSILFLTLSLSPFLFTLPSGRQRFILAVLLTYT